MFIRFKPLPNSLTEPFCTLAGLQKTLVGAIHRLHPLRKTFVEPFGILVGENNLRVALRNPGDFAPVIDTELPETDVEAMNAERIQWELKRFWAGIGKSALQGGFRGYTARTKQSEEGRITADD